MFACKEFAIGQLITKITQVEGKEYTIEIKQVGKTNLMTLDLKSKEIN